MYNHQKAQELRDSGFVKVLKKESTDEVLIAFAGFGARRGRFQFYRQFKYAPSNVILVNCDPLTSYYQFGVTPKGKLEDTILGLNQMISELTDSPRITTFGGSMGGYGALLYGCLLGVEQIIALGPRTPVNSGVLEKSPTYSEHVNQYLSLEKKQFANASRKSIIFGDRLIQDHASFIEFSRLRNTTLTMYLDTCHELVQPITRKYGLIPTVTRIKSNQPIGKIYKRLDFDVDEREVLVGRLMDTTWIRKSTRRDFQSLYDANQPLVDSSYLYSALMARHFFNTGATRAGKAMLKASLDICVSLLALEILEQNVSRFKKRYLETVLSSTEACLSSNERMAYGEILKMFSVYACLRMQLGQTNRVLQLLALFSGRDDLLKLLKEHLMQNPVFEPIAEKI